MKIYLAGTSVETPRKTPVLCELFKKSNKLHSYFHISLFEKKWWRMNRKNKVKLFLDSGAFSAMTQKTSIDIYEYIDFIKKHESELEVYANLDVIRNPEKTWENQKIMEEAGLNPLPTFHYGEDPLWLKKYIDSGYEYIALGGMVKTPNLVGWLDDMWEEYLTDSNGMPIIKVHGFGMTSLRLMLRYPWYSVDSTSWVVTGRMGSVYIPKWKNGNWVYDVDSLKIAVSSQSPSLKDSGQHFQTLCKTEQLIILKYLEEKGYSMGISEFKEEEQTYILAENEKWAEKKPSNKTKKRRVEVIVEEGISNKYQLRDELNVMYFLDLEESMRQWPWAFLNPRKMNKLF